MSFPTTKALTHPQISTREELIKALHSAAIVEHMLTCAYLYSAFSIRRKRADFPVEMQGQQAEVTIEISRMWLSQILLVARQEMEHLGIVMNLLAAVGADPYFERPQFPQPAILLSAPFTLERFSLDSIRRFICYERPAFLNPTFCTPPPRELAPHPTLNPLGFGTVQELYDEIGAAFQTMPVEKVFRGNTDRQLPQPTFGYAINLASVTNRSEANAAVQQILFEGEGIGENPMSEDAHYQKFITVLGGLEAAIAQNPHFDPAFPVVANPMTRPHPDGREGSLITDPNSLLAMEFFNNCYNTMLVMLNTFFCTYSTGSVPEPRPQAALFYAAFFPLMTMVLRPLGEIIVHMPAGPEFPGQNAGPGFENFDPIAFEPTYDWNYDRLEQLIQQAYCLIDIVPAPYRNRMKFVWENLTSTRIHLGAIWQHGV